MDPLKGNIEIQKESDSLTTIKIDGNNGNITLGGNYADGDILITNRDGKITIGINGQKAISLLEITVLKEVW